MTRRLARAGAAALAAFLADPGVRGYARSIVLRWAALVAVVVLLRLMALVLGGGR
jgi:hypothetical protein